MVKLRRLLGGASEAHYECMYTKHMTQKRKTWHDGFVALHGSRKLVLFEDEPPEGKVLEQVNMTVHDWERKDEEYITLTKFLVEIINETPLNTSTPGGGGEGSDNGNGLAEPASLQRPRTASAPTRAVGIAPVRRQQPLHGKFKSPLASGSGNARGVTNSSSVGTNPAQVAPPPSRPPQLNKRKLPPSEMIAATDPLDFGRTPTSEWSYAPHAFARTPREVTAVWFAGETQRPTTS